MSQSYSLYLPSYTIGPDCYKEIPAVVKRYGKKIVLVGGKTALSVATEAIKEGIAGSDLEIIGSEWFGGDATYENVAMLMEKEVVQKADMIFGVGGGRAADCCKVLADKMGKPLFNFPTLASNCASSTALCVMYKPDGSMAGYYYRPRCCDHVFINTKIIAESPVELFWAGIGDAMSKEFEVKLATRGVNLFHTPLLGQAIACACANPLLQYGKQALEDCRNNVESKAISETALDIIITTGMVSNLVIGGTDYYYNASLAHCFYNAYTKLPQAHKHLHGEVVSFGVLVLLTCDEDPDRDKIAKFHKELGLPVTLAEIEVSPEDIEVILDDCPHHLDWSKTPYEVSRERFKKAIYDMDAYGKTL